MKKFIIFYFLAIFFFFTFFSAGVIDSQDGFLYMAVARNIYYTGQPTGPIDEYNTKSRQNIPMSVALGRDGKPYSATGLGFSLAFLPSVALTDLFYKFYNVTPPQHYPIDADWLIGLFAGFTNGFFGALLGVILFIYLTKLGLNKREALTISLVSLFATNLSAYSKHTFAHMMFLTFLTLSFLLLKLQSKSDKKILLLLSGITYGITAITYNLTFTLSSIPLFIYYLLLNFKNISSCIRAIKKIIKDLLLFACGFLPFLIVIMWFDNLRYGGGVSISSAMMVSYASNRFADFPITVFFEGLWGQLFSPGRSFFIYSPILLIIIIFWNKLKSTIKPEIVCFVSLFIIYILFYSTFYTRSPEGFATLWAGESSWGPRYLTPLIPFGMLLVGSIFHRLNNKNKLFVFYPLVAIGIFVGLLGIILPYQIKYHNTEPEFKLNGSTYTNFTYINLLPRYSPIMTMPKQLIKLAIDFPSTFQHGLYNVHFIDGIFPPFNVGQGRWRTIGEKGYITFDNSNIDPINKLTFGLINHPTGESSDSAKINFILNGHPLLQQPISLVITERKQIEIPVKKEFLYPKNNQLVIDISYPGNSDPVKRSQLLALLAFFINNHVVNMESLDYPYVSGFGSSMAHVQYFNFGKATKDPWILWEIHTQLYERLPDLWWIRNLYYWDIPKRFILGLLMINTIGFIGTAFLSKKYFKKLRVR